MPYKTIVVHVSDKRRAESILAPAMQLAAKNNAHLVGLHAYASMPAPPIPVPFTSEVLSRIVADVHQNAESIAATFYRLTSGQPFTSEWHLQQLPQTELASAVMREGRAADLIVAGQTDSDWDLSPMLDFPERLALESGRPVLVIPYVGAYENIGRNIVIAWKGSREAARAVFDALPLLEAAENVTILEFKERGNRSDSLAPDTSIAAALARHGIKPVIYSSAAPDIDIGDEILSRLVDLGADLLVMGAYGHSRMRELVFGGVTRHIARHMTVPTLFSH